MKRKTIIIPDSVDRDLKLLAIIAGVSFKKYLEDLLTEHTKGHPNLKKYVNPKGKNR